MESRTDRDRCMQKFMGSLFELPLSSLSLSLSLKHTHIRTHTYTYKHTLSLSISISLLHSLLSPSFQHAHEKRIREEQKMEMILTFSIRPGLNGLNAPLVRPPVTHVPGDGGGPRSRSK